MLKLENKKIVWNSNLVLIIQVGFAVEKYLYLVWESNMTMHSVYFKEHEGVQDSIGHQSSASTPWWSRLGTQLPYVDPVSQLRSSIVGNHFNGDQYTATKFGEHCMEQGSEKGNTSHFTIFPGSSLSSVFYSTLNGQYLN